MIKVSDTVSKIIESDVIAFESLRKGDLNMSSYASKINKRVSDICMKPVKIGSIVAALRRYVFKKDRKTDFLPTIDIDSLSIQTGLTEITYTKNQKSLEEIIKSESQIEEDHFFTITQGISEITIIASSKFLNKFTKDIKLKPKIVIKNLTAIGVNFNESYMSVPNTIFSLTSKIASERINLIEIVSTYTGIVFIVNDEEVNKAINSLQDFYSKS